MEGLCYFHRIGKSNAVLIVGAYPAITDLLVRKECLFEFYEKM
jgi:hypothetical protein